MCIPNLNNATSHKALITCIPNLNISKTLIHFLANHAVFI